MLKKVLASELRVGMKVDSFCGSWMDHPFWKTSFVIEDYKLLQKILASGVEEVMIESDAPESGQGDEGEEDGEGSQAESSRSLTQAAAEARQTASVAYSAEVARAEKLCARAGHAMKQLFAETRMGQALNTDLAKSVAEEISSSVMRNQGALISVARLKNKDDYTYLHSVAVCALMVSLAQTLGLSDAEARAAGLAGLLHDIGKIAVPTEILNKPGALTDDEFRQIKNHPSAGHAMLLLMEGLDPGALDVCLHHHERMDGRGYPEGLTGDKISLLAKMGAVCDVYDAITSDRPYKKGWHPAESIKKMAEWSGAHLDPRVFQAFVKSVGIYPSGSLVRLASDRLAIVLDQNPRSLLTPTVKVFYSTAKEFRINPILLDLARAQDKIVAIERPDAWNFPDFDQLSRSGC